MPKSMCSVEDCDRPRYLREWCNAHYLRWQRHGDPLGGGPSRRSSLHDDPVALFWSKVDKADGCWLWTKATTTGYGISARMPGIGSRLAHRIAWELTNGPVPDGLFVCHVCDNPPCCRPDHLFLGTNRDNVDDMIAKGRTLVGRGRWNAKLYETDIPDIRQRLASGEAHADIGAAYGVSQNAISQIARGLTWKHV